MLQVQRKILQNECFGIGLSITVAESTAANFVVNVATVAESTAANFVVAPWYDVDATAEAHRFGRGWR